MKFLCVDCDEQMALVNTAGPDRGSMTVVFGCTACGRQVAMLTNEMETQMVKSLGVKIGNANAAPAGHMEVTQGGLAAGPASNGGSKCPFTGAVQDAYAQTGGGISWTAEARERMDRIPAYVRPMVEKGIEQFASRDGITEIDAEVLERIRGELGM